MDENAISKIVVDAAYHIHIKLGPGLLESVYLRILKYELEKRGLQVEKEVGVSFTYDGLTFDEGFRADLIVNRKVIVEIKSAEHTHPVHKKQLLTYLTTLVTLFNTHVHPGEMAIGILPVTPAPPVAPFPPPSPTLLSVKVTVE